MYEKNYEILKKMVEDREIIIPVAEHFNADGVFNLERNLKVWNAAIAKFQQIPLWEEGAPGYSPEKDPLQPPPSLIFIPRQGEGGPRGTVIVAHGGGFLSRTGCEGMNVALYFAQKGFNTAILTYRLRPYTRYDALADMQRAIRLIRSRQEELGVTGKVAAMGFSAGGMLSGNAATHFDGGDPAASDPVERQSSRPDAAVIGYGAFAGTAFPLPFGTEESPQERADRYYMANESHVTPETPPCFLWQTNGDDPRHSFALGSALTAAGVEFELHCFPRGRHGLALADGNNDLGSHIPHVAHWAPLCVEWLEEQGL